MLIELEIRNQGKNRRQNVFDKRSKGDMAFVEDKIEDKMSLINDAK